ncbi:MAG: TIR domain-containing protein [Acidobacteriota bacterium]
MKTFLSWSGTQSHQIALSLRDWLPSVLQALRPYVSSEDIDKGARWSSDIAAELEDASYGIICVTQENLRAPWVHFEAGALSKSLDKSHVVPFLLGVKRSEVPGPLIQFQSVIFDRDDVLKMVRSLNQRLGEEERLTEERVRDSFDVWWPRLKADLENIASAKPATEPAKEKPSSSEAILEEILELTRANQRLLSDPKQLAPQEKVYVRLPIVHGQDLVRTLDRLREFALHLAHLLDMDSPVDRDALTPVTAELMKDINRIAEILSNENCIPRSDLYWLQPRRSEGPE